MIEVWKIGFDTIAKYKKEASKEMLCFAMNTEYFGLFVDGELRAFTGILWRHHKAIFKNHYVIPKHRGQGYFKILLRFSLERASGFSIEATCTPMSVRHYLHLGFSPVKYYKNGCVKVIYENH